ncbi:MAG TPA: RluA family pseudouridine synthase, partial [Tepidisphaeraceae bacterium]|nr:RluA family pseudouridine synthase [Tepidisphaeraceae bacterium]
MLEILHQSSDLVGIHKPAGLASIPGGFERSAANVALARQLGLPFKGDADPRVRVIHRIDKDTSGVLLFALNRPAQQFVSLQFQNNQIEKSYVALVVGSMKDDSGEIDAPIAKHASDKLRRRVHKTGKPSMTRWQVMQRFRDYTLVRVFPKTGRTHQIRVHLKHIGHPLAVDLLYHSPKIDGVYLSRFKKNYRATMDEERPLIGRLTLHAESLKLHALDGSPIEIRAELPK